jgi:hypothetical protein
MLARVGSCIGRRGLGLEEAFSVVEEIGVKEEAFVDLDFEEKEP